ncbi:MAG: hypothetical protein ACRC4M_00420 [Mycoplasma sp.]
MDITKLSPLNVVITDHALQRAKERMSINAKKDSLEFEFKLKEVIQRAQFRDDDGFKLFYELIYDNIKYEIVANRRHDQIIINTIIPKGK